MVGYRKELTLTSTLLSLTLLTISVNAAPSSSSFDGYELIEVSPSSLQQLNFLHQLEHTDEEFDIWQYPAVDGSQNGTVLVAPRLLSAFKEQLQMQNIPWTVASYDVAPLLQASSAQPEFVRISSGNSFHTAYHSYIDIELFLKRLIFKYDDNIELSNLDLQTYRGRNVVLVRLHGARSNSPKKAIVVESVIHAREWAAGASNLYAIEELLKGYAQGSKEIVTMLDTYDWYFIPITNPDGYEYTRIGSHTRLWRKNLHRFDFCHGVDLNRNFDIKWGTTGVSRKCSSNTYCGPKALSENETRNIKNLLTTLKGRLVGYLAVHAFGQYLLLPWAYSDTNDKPSNYKELYRVANEMKKAIKKTHGKDFKVGSPKTLLNYAASGSVMDYVLAKYPGTYTISYELRPTFSGPGFLLPPDQIVPSGQEFLASLKAFARELKTN